MSQVKSNNKLRILKLLELNTIRTQYNLNKQTINKQNKQDNQRNTRLNINQLFMNYKKK